MQCMCAFALFYDMCKRIIIITISWKSTANTTNSLGLDRWFVCVFYGVAHTSHHVYVVLIIWYNVERKLCIYLMFMYRKMTSPSTQLSLFCIRLLFVYRAMILHIMQWFIHKTHIRARKFPNRMFRISMYYCYATYTCRHKNVSTVFFLCYRK